MKKYFPKDIPSVIKHWFGIRVNSILAPKQYYKPHNLPGSINVEWEYNKKNKSYYAEVTNLPGLYTTSRSSEDIIKNLNSIVYKFFDTPDHIAEKDMKRGLRYNPPIAQIEEITRQGGSVRTELKLALN